VAYEFSGLVDDLRPSAEALLSAAQAAGMNPVVTSTYRSESSQLKLYNAYLAGRSLYPAAPPGHSAHGYGWAFDMVVQGEGAQQACGEFWESMGGTWGGRFNDPIHFELPGASAYLKSMLG